VDLAHRPSPRPGAHHEAARTAAQEAEKVTRKSSMSPFSAGPTDD
jgi:hypothetical protein